MTLTRGEQVLELESALPGDFNWVNTAMAAVALLESGIAPQDVARAVLTRPQVPGRMELVAPSDPTREDLPTAVVDFAHTPDAMRLTLEAVRAITPGRLIVVFSSDGDRDHGKRPMLGAVAAELAEVKRAVLANPSPRRQLTALLETLADLGTDAALAADASLRAGLSIRGGEVIDTRILA